MLRMEGRGHSTSERESMAVKVGNDRGRRGQNLKSLPRQARRVVPLSPGKELQGRYVPCLQVRKCLLRSVLGVV